MPNNIPEPVSRKEQFLAGAAGREVNLPAPVTREEIYLEAIAVSGKQGVGIIPPIEKTGTSGNVDTYTVRYTDGTSSTFTVTNGSVTSVNGETGDVQLNVVDNAEQLVSSVFVEDKVPYNFRTSGGSADIGNRETDKIVGGTIAWNQLVNTSDTTCTVPSGHKYYSNISDTKTIAQSDGTSFAVTGATDNVCDLTQMFGSTIADYIYSLETANAGAGVAWFKKLFPKDYYAYNTGELMSVNVSAHNTIGFNAWDEEYTTGAIKPTNGEVNTGLTDRIRSKNYIPIMPNTIYYWNTNNNYVGVIAYYDINKTFISSVENKRNTTLTTPTNAYYMRFSMLGAYGTTYHNDICINLHWDGERDGEYEEYVKHEYPLDESLTLRGIPKLDANNDLYYDGDTYEADGTVTRNWNLVNLSTLDWERVASTYYEGMYYFRASISGAKALADGVCSAYVKGTGSQAGQYGLSIDKTWNSSTSNFLIRDDSYTDAATFKTAMSGAYLVYELAEPTTETAEPYQNPQIVDDFGTEEYVDYAESQGTRDVAIPVGHETQYQNNLRAKLEMAPNSPDGNGDYIVRQTNGINEYVPLVIPAELPTMPTTAGAYVLICTVADGQATLSWLEAND